MLDDSGCCDCDMSIEIVIVRANGNLPEHVCGEVRVVYQSPLPCKESTCRV